MERLTIYFPKHIQLEKPLDRLQQIALKLDRSANYLVVRSIMQFIEREEKKDPEAVADSNV